MYSVRCKPKRIIRDRIIRIGGMERSEEQVKNLQVHSNINNTDLSAVLSDNEINALANMFLNIIRNDEQRENIKK